MSGACNRVTQSPTRYPQSPGVPIPIQPGSPVTRCASPARCPQSPGTPRHPVSPADQDSPLPGEPRSPARCPLSPRTPRHPVSPVDRDSPFPGAPKSLTRCPQAPGIDSSPVVMGSQRAPCPSPSSDKCRETLLENQKYACGPATSRCSVVDACTCVEEATALAGAHGICHVHLALECSCVRSPEFEHVCCVLRSRQRMRDGLSANPMHPCTRRQPHTRRHMKKARANRSTPDARTRARTHEINP